MTREQAEEILARIPVLSVGRPANKTGRERKRQSDGAKIRTDAIEKVRPDFPVASLKRNENVVLPPLCKKSALPDDGVFHTWKSLPQIEKFTDISVFPADSAGREKDDPMYKKQGEEFFSAVALRFENANVSAKEERKLRGRLSTLKTEEQLRKAAQEQERRQAAAKERRIASVHSKRATADARETMTPWHKRAAMLLIPVVLVAFLLFGVVVPLVSYKACTSGKNTYTVQDGFVFFEYADGMVSVSAPEYAENVRFPSSYRGKPVTVIECPESTKKNARVRSVEIPESVKKIGARAFAGCVNLQSVRLPEKLESIGEQAFALCENLDELYLPAVSEIGNLAFYNCGSFEKVEILHPEVRFNNLAFHGCTIKEITASVSVIAALPKSKVEKVTLIQGESIPNSLFYGCATLKEVEFPKDVEEIHSNAFYMCSALEEAELPEGITLLGDSVFSGCENLKRITLPRTLTSVGKYLFVNCACLGEIRFGGSVREWEEVEKDPEWDVYLRNEPYSIICSDGEVTS